MNEDEPKLPAQLRPRLTASGRTFNATEFLQEYPVEVDEVWKVGDRSPINADCAAEQTSGFTIFLTDVASEYWRQDDDLQERLFEWGIALSALRDYPVTVEAVLVYYNDVLIVQPPLLGMLAGLGIGLRVIQYSNQPN